MEHNQELLDCLGDCSLRTWVLSHIDCMRPTLSDAYVGEPVTAGGVKMWVDHVDNCFHFEYEGQHYIKGVVECLCIKDMTAYQIIWDNISASVQ